MRLTECSFSEDTKVKFQTRNLVNLNQNIHGYPMYFHINSGTSLLIRPQPFPFPSFKIYCSVTISSSMLHNVLMQFKVPLSEVRRSKQHFLLQHQLPDVKIIITTPRVFLVIHWTSQFLRRIMCFKELSMLPFSYYNILQQNFLLFLKKSCNRMLYAGCCNCV